MELLRNSCTQNNFFCHTSKLDCMALSLECLLAKRRPKRLLLSTVSLNTILLLHSVTFPLKASHLTLLIIPVHPTSSLNIFLVITLQLHKITFQRVIILHVRVTKNASTSNIFTLKHKRSGFKTKRTTIPLDLAFFCHQSLYIVALQNICLTTSTLDQFRNKSSWDS